jgi:hypothetical protein
MAGNGFASHRRRVRCWATIILSSRGDHLMDLGLIGLGLFDATHLTCPAQHDDDLLGNSVIRSFASSLTIRKKCPAVGCDVIVGRSRARRPARSAHPVRVMSTADPFQG